MAASRTLSVICWRMRTNWTSTNSRLLAGPFVLNIYMSSIYLLLNRSQFSHPDRGVFRDAKPTQYVTNKKSVTSHSTAHAPPDKVTTGHPDEHSRTWPSEHLSHLSRLASARVVTITAVDRSPKLEPGEILHRLLRSVQNLARGKPNASVARKICVNAPEDCTLEVGIESRNSAVVSRALA